MALAALKKTPLYTALHFQVLTFSFRMQLFANKLTKVVGQGEKCAA